MSSMIKCNLNVNMTAFTPSSAKGTPASVTATLDIKGQTAPPDGGAPYFTMKDGTLYVNVPDGTPARLQFFLVNQTGDATAYGLCGVFMQSVPKGYTQVSGEFPLIVISGNISVQVTWGLYSFTPSVNSLSVVDTNTMDGAWEYALGVQNFSTLEIGIYDPEVENSPEET
jgi:hypothetical protein